MYNQGMMKTKTGITLSTRLLCLCMIVSGMSAVQAQLPYERDYPVMNYYEAGASGPVSELLQSINAGETTLEYDPQQGYLPALLELLDIDPSSQLLVFSKTARKGRFISPQTPRALYFNDEVYVGFVPDTPGLELAVMDPALGPVFFELDRQRGEGALEVSRQNSVCLRCHDSLTNSGGGTPRFMMSSVLVNELGEIASHEVSIITNNSTPLESRWGGWYVTGFHGEQANLGNFTYQAGQSLADAELLSNGNRADLSDLLDTGNYLTPYSDIVALLVMQHQIEVQNVMTRVNWNYQQRLAENAQLQDGELEELARPLLDALLMANEAELGDSIEGVSGYSDYFQSLGPEDEQGRSLRDLDLQERVFTYPLSYLIYSDAFQSLPQALLRHLKTALHDILSGAQDHPDYPYLDARLRNEILAIVAQTSPGFFL